MPDLEVEVGTFSPSCREKVRKMANSTKPSHGRQEGFSLLEVLIALVFLAIGLLAFASLQVTSVRGNIFSYNLTQATYAAQDRIEFLKNIAFDSPQLQAGDYNDGSITASGVVYRRTYTVATEGNRKRIIYIVTWTDGIPHRISFTTIRSL